MVFQNYALYPAHDGAGESRVRAQDARGRRAEIEKRVDQAAAISRSKRVLDRSPRSSPAASGSGSRWAGRLCASRKCFCSTSRSPISTPSSGCETRAEIARLHRRLKATIIYVTHDQEEAMTLGDRIVVMRDGVIQQVAPPMELYQRPANQFVAGFVGSPAMNFLPRAEAPSAIPPRGVTLGIRPHDITIVAAGAGDENAYVELVESRGNEQLVYLCLRGNNQGPAIRIVAPPEIAVEPERMVGIRFDREKLHWFDEQGRRA